MRKLLHFWSVAVVMCISLLALAACSNFSPAPTPEPWLTHYPTIHYTIETPPDWDQRYGPGDSVHFWASDEHASLTIIHDYSESGWPDRYTVDERVEYSLVYLEDHPGFELNAIENVSPGVRRITYKYTGQQRDCNWEAHSLQVLTEKENYFVTARVCRPGFDEYDEAFVNRMLDSFSYSKEMSQLKWRTHSPTDYYTLETPPDWEVDYEPRDESSDDIGSRLHIAYISQKHRFAELRISESYSELGWLDRHTVDTLADVDLAYAENLPGFQLIYLWDDSPNVKKSIYRYGGESSCRMKADNLYIRTEHRSFSVRLSVCNVAQHAFDEAFVNRVLDSFTYTE